MTDPWAREVEVAMRRRQWLAEQVAANERRIELLLMRIPPAQPVSVPHSLTSE